MKNQSIETEIFFFIIFGRHRTIAFDFEKSASNQYSPNLVVLLFIIALAIFSQLD